MGMKESYLLFLSARRAVVSHLQWLLFPEKKNGRNKTSCYIVQDMQMLNEQHLPLCLYANANTGNPTLKPCWISITLFGSVILYNSCRFEPIFCHQFIACLSVFTPLEEASYAVHGWQLCNTCKGTFPEKKKGRRKTSCYIVQGMQMLYEQHLPLCSTQRGAQEIQDRISQLFFYFKHRYSA